MTWTKQDKPDPVIRVQPWQLDKHPLLTFRHPHGEKLHVVPDGDGRFVLVDGSGWQEITGYWPAEIIMDTAECLKIKEFVALACSTEGG